MGALGADIIEGLTAALAEARGEPSGCVVHQVAAAPDVRALRERLGLSRAEFAAAYAIPLATVTKWERGDRSPGPVAAAYLRVIARAPDEARSAHAVISAA